MKKDLSNHQESAQGSLSDCCFTPAEIQAILEENRKLKRVCSDQKRELKLQKKRIDYLKNEVDAFGKLWIEAGKFTFEWKSEHDAWLNEVAIKNVKRFKKCNKCGEKRPVDFFMAYADNRVPGEINYRADCRLCSGTMVELNDEYFAEQKEKNKAHENKWFNMMKKLKRLEIAAQTLDIPEGQEVIGLRQFRTDMDNSVVKKLPKCKIIWVKSHSEVVFAVVTQDTLASLLMLKDFS